MINRILAAVVTALVAVGPLFAEAPVEGSSSPPPGVAEGQACAVPAFGAECCGDGRIPGALFWTRGDYLFGWFQRSQLPPLVTTSPPGTPQTLAGVLGPTTTVLVGGTGVGGDSRSGFRLEAGFWLDSEQRFGIEGGFSMLESQSATFAFTSSGSTILARPFVSALDDSAQSVLVAFPGSSAGGIEVHATSGAFYEAHADLTERFRPCSWLLLDGLIGYRYYQYRDGVRIRETISPSNPNFVVGTTLTGIDEFNARNDFQGCDMGVRAHITSGNLGVELLGKLAFGRLHQGVNIGGGQTVTVPGLAPVNTVGGLYALSSNIGLHTQNDFAVMPELGATLSWNVSDNLRLRFGYSMLYLDSILRAADQIELSVNPNLFLPNGRALGGPNEPAPRLRQTGIWNQTLNLGAEITF